uniref:Glutamate synthase alpha subunit C-terminal domain-containing protein n=1 Tax=Physcomitrium patens TaxID=3218 RepID=A0A2K1J355_PHYPA|nr:hypothetical protein PHYPA_021803 [Physcomitrium patens]
MVIERFDVRISRTKLVVEGIGDHKCEYMIGSIIMVFDKTWKNFVAGISGGVVWVLYKEGTF